MVAPPCFNSLKQQTTFSWKKINKDDRKIPNIMTKIIIITTAFNLLFINATFSTLADVAADPVAADPKPDTRGCSSPDSSMSSVDRGGRQSGISETRASVGCAGVLVQMWRDFLLCYATPGLLRWSLWWALATCGHNLVLLFVQMLWKHIEPSSSFAAYNGGVEAVSSLFGEPILVILCL